MPAILADHKKAPISAGLFHFGVPGFTLAAENSYMARICVLSRDL